jgi:hypothetical protein
LLRCTGSGKVDRRGDDAFGLVCSPRCAREARCSPRRGPTNNVVHSSETLLAKVWCTMVPRGSCHRCRALLVAPPGWHAGSHTSLHPPCTRLELASSMKPCAPSNRCTRAPASKLVMTPWFVGGYASITCSIQKDDEKNQCMKISPEL